MVNQQSLLYIILFYRKLYASEQDCIISKNQIALATSIVYANLRIVNVEIFPIGNFIPCQRV